MELSGRGKLQKANLDVVMNYGANFLEILATGHEVLDSQAATVRFLASSNMS